MGHAGSVAEADIPIIGVGHVGSLVLGLPTNNDGIVPLIDSQVGVVNSLVVSQALNWSVVLRKGKRVFAPTLNP